MANNVEIEERNIHWAALESMRSALERLALEPDFLLVDGFRLDDVHYSQEKVRQGDKKSSDPARQNRYRGNRNPRQNDHFEHDRVDP